MRALLAIALGAAVIATTAQGATGTGRAQVVIDGYPYSSACPGAGVRDDVDRWKMNTCNCTSYVAWALQRNGFRVDWFVPGAMDAWNWPHVARLHYVPTGAVPRVGAVAVWPALTRFGHVAFVTAVNNDGTFAVAEYNLPWWLGGVRFGFDERATVAATGVTFIYVPPRTRRMR